MNDENDFCPFIFQITQVEFFLMFNNKPVHEMELM